MSASLEGIAPRRPKTGREWLWMTPLLLASLIYLILAMWLAHTKAPWYDEGLDANPAYDLAFHGQMGSNVAEPSGIFLNAYFRGIQQRTYIAMPNNLVALAAWFRIFGFSAFSARGYSICWGLITICVLFYILQRLFRDRRVAQLATLLTAIDFIFLWSNADARMDAAASALALCSVAAYLYFRDKDYQKAVVTSQVLGACAVFTHPNSALVMLTLAILAWRYDRGRWQLRGRRYLALAITPYLLFGLFWSLYILQSPGDFKAQFFAVAAGHNSERITRIFRPGIALGAELARHLAAYSIGGPWAAVMKGWMAVVPLFYLPPMVWFFWKWRQHKAPTQVFLFYTVLMVLAMTFLNGFKGDFYLIYVVPLYDSILAAWLINLWSRSFTGKYVAVAVALAFVTVQLSMSILHIRADEYHRDYEPAIRELARDRAEGKSIVGTAALGFGLDYTGFKDDVRLGMYSGLDPDVLVMDRSYRLYAGYFGAEEPAVFGHIVALLTTKYELAAQHGSFWIFERVSPGANGNVAPPVDVGRIVAVETNSRAKYFFRLLFSANKMRDPEESSL